MDLIWIYTILVAAILVVWLLFVVHIFKNFRK